MVSDRLRFIKRVVNSLPKLLFNSLLLFILEHVKKYASEEAFRGTDVRSYIRPDEESSSESELSDLSEEDEAQDMEL